MFEEVFDSLLDWAHERRLQRTRSGGVIASDIKWKLQIVDTSGTKVIVLYREVSPFLVLY